MLAIKSPHPTGGDGDHPTGEKSSGNQHVALENGDSHGVFSLKMLICNSFLLFIYQKVIICNNNI